MNMNAKELDQAIRNVFGSYFEISCNRKLNGRTFAYVLESFDLQGRTITGTDKMIDSYYIYENCYVFQQKIKHGTVKQMMEEMYRTVKPVLKLEDRHYKTTLHFIVFTSLDDSLVKEIKAFRKTYLLKLGFKGSIHTDLTAVDLQKKVICGYKTAEALQKPLREELFK